ncbi:MAG: pantoate--beta-alanine ligase [Gemmatimonas sp.]|nr:pantoate--beta-alanine ligase [Gemmatimonas sp.]
MIHIESLAALRAVVRDAVASRQAVRFVPTMGALHDGHAALIRAARADGGLVLVSVFVNPTQFGPNEDFARYPRTPGADAALATKAGADALWAPLVEDVYPAGPSARLSAGALGAVWEGAFRPGHFDGVATVVAKLLVASGADVLYLGEKDYQQTVVVRRLIRDLLLTTEVRVVPTVREPDGLALSSRNRYLSADDRRAAAAISRGLRACAKLAADGERRADALLVHLQDVIGGEPRVTVQYAGIADPDTLEPVTLLNAPARALVAAYVGATRLIDNILLVPPTP